MNERIAARCPGARALLLLSWPLVLLIVQWPTIAAGQADRPLEQGNKTVQLSDVWQRYQFYARSTDAIQWMQDDDYYAELTNNRALVKYRVDADEAVDTIIAPEEMTQPADTTALQPVSYKFGPEEAQVLLMTDKRQIYRRSFTVRCYVFDRQSGQMQAINEGQPIANPAFSPDGQRLAYTFENDLYYVNLESGERTAVTQDGEKNKIINGSTDWVYEEEFAIVKAYWWAPNSEKIAFLRFDEAHVKMFSIDHYEGDMYPRQERFKYPKAGERNAIVYLKMYDLASQQTQQIDLVNGDTSQYLPRVTWTRTADKLAVMRTNRIQNKLDVILVDPETGENEVILTETSDTWVSEPDDNTWLFLEDSDRFLWQSERSGYNHVYLYNYEGEQLRQITSGDWPVMNLYGLREAQRDRNALLYFQAAKQSPLERHLYQIQLNGRNQRRLTDREGWHEGRFSTNMNYYMDSYSNVATPTQATLYKAGGPKIRTVQANERAANAIDSFKIAPKEFFSFETDYGLKLNGWMIKPRDFDPDKQYPVLMFTYGGPKVQVVKKQYDAFNFFWYQTLADQGYIVMAVDNRGSGARGTDFKKATYMELGKLELKDQMAAARYIGDQSYVDSSRIGIWGWSFGGYLTSLCLTKGADLFKAGIAVAPVTNWRFYDTIYTERFMRKPQDNPDGYDDNSPLNHAAKLDGNYLLVHGTADDNVHFQNSMEMVKALVSAGKQFDTFFYPNKAHGITGGGARYHLYKKMTRFIEQNL